MQKLEAVSARTHAHTHTLTHSLTHTQTHSHTNTHTHIIWNLRETDTIMQSVRVQLTEYLSTFKFCAGVSLYLHSYCRPRVFKMLSGVCALGQSTSLRTYFDILTINSKKVAVFFLEDTGKIFWSTSLSFKQRLQRSAACVQWSNHRNMHACGKVTRLDFYSLFFVGLTDRMGFLF